MRLAVKRRNRQPSISSAFWRMRSRSNAARELERDALRRIGVVELGDDKPGAVHAVMVHRRLDAMGRQNPGQFRLGAAVGHRRPQRSRAQRLSQHADPRSPP